MTTEAAERLYLTQHQYELHGRKTVVYNPNNLGKLPTIYAFSGADKGGDGPAYALAEDGPCLGSHWCSQEGYVPSDLGVLEDCRPDRHEDYREHYPGGYRMEFVRAADIDSHAGLKAAMELNRKLAAEKKASEENTEKA